MPATNSRPLSPTDHEAAPSGDGAGGRRGAASDSSNPHGGPGRGQGRKRLPEGERTVVATVRLTPARRAKLRRLGARWLAKAIDRAKEPGAT